jgi:NAD(P)-dependent dehydrogenase (short-subunit alcohol dehydrogenase family)
MEPSNHPVALIVGGSSGIGLATAKRLLERHIPVTIVGKSQDKLETAVRELSMLGTVEAFPADLYAPNDVQRILAFAEHHSRHIKYLVNAAGYFKPISFLDHTPEDYDIYLNLNRALFFISQAVAKNMAANGGGSIVHIGSMWARQAVKATPSSAYSMAKAGLHALTQHMAMELADHKIRVNAVSPAVVNTPIYQAFIEPSEVDETLPPSTGYTQSAGLGLLTTWPESSNSY